MARGGGGVSGEPGDRAATGGAAGRDAGVAARCVDLAGQRGRVAEAQGEWQEAGAAYRESLAIARQLVERLGRTPESLDDLAASLLNVARLPEGDAAAAEEARAIYQSLADRFPDVPRYRVQLERLTLRDRQMADPEDPARES